VGTSMPSMTTRSPKEVVKDVHKGYYSAGEYSDNRYIETFLPSCQGTRATILPPLLRRFALFRSRYVTGGLRRIVALALRAFGRFPLFCYLLWTFEVA
jgi:hypothetical protein